MPLEALKSYLISQPAGKVKDDDHLESLLVNAWDRLDGSGAAGWNHTN